MHEPTPTASTTPASSGEPSRSVFEAEADSDLPSLEPSLLGGAKPTALPVRAAQRVYAVDVLRGVAVLGILAMNIVHFAWPMAGYDNPSFSGGDHPANVAAWFLNQVLFSGKMMTIFSMLFGAGLVLMYDRATQRGARLAGTYYRRVGWLLVIGLIHAYLIWSGDILVAYALCGLVLFLFRRKTPRTLIVLGTVLLLIGTLAMTGFMAIGRMSEQAAAAVARMEGTEQKPSEVQLQLAEAWEGGMRSFIRPSAEDLAREVSIYRGGYRGIVVRRAPEVLMMQTSLFVLLLGWMAGGRMLLGMGLMKLGIFSAERTPRFYNEMAAVSYLVGLPLTIIGAISLWRHGFDAMADLSASLLIALGMVPVALGHVAVVNRLVQAGLLRGATDRLASVGRMALTNYLMQSLIATTLFYGYSLGLFARIDRVGLWVVVLAIWAFQLVFSTWWLRSHAYGPAEWLWRWLTYGRRVRDSALPAGDSVSMER